MNRRTARPKPAAATKPYVVESDDDMSLSEFLANYGYLLARPNGHLWLAGLLSGSQLEYARQVIAARTEGIEARYGTATPATPAPKLVQRRAPRRTAHPIQRAA